MADDADRAADREQAARDDALADVRRSPSLVPAGFCHYCNAPVPPSHLFCDADCRADHDYMTERRKAQGQL